MTKLRMYTSFTVLLLFAASFAVGQQRPESNKRPTFYFYHTVVLEASEVQRALRNPEFDHFKLFYTDEGSETYILSGYAENASDEPISDLVRLNQLKSRSVPVPKRFKNLEMSGHLNLTRQMLMDHDADGSEDYVLTPRKCWHNGKTKDYVSYRFSNRAEPASGEFTDEFLTASLKAFILNPSPPY